MPGKEKNKSLEELSFKLIKTNTKFAAACHLCKMKFQNKSERQLRKHRKICNPECTKLKKKLQKAINEESTINDTYTTKMSVRHPRACQGASSTSISSSKKAESPCDHETTVKPGATLAETLYKIDRAKETDAFAKFIFGCNLPLRLVDSALFKNFIEKIRPGFTTKLPDSNTILTTLLDNTYENHISSTKSLIGSDAILLIDSWKNNITYIDNFVSMLQYANGKQVLLDAWKFPVDDSKIFDKLCEIVAESIHKAKELYSIDVYAVVSDKVDTIDKWKNPANNLIWFSSSNRHVVNLFANDILNKELTDKVIFLLKKFKENNLEKLIVEKGGSFINLPSDTSLCSYQEMYRCLIQNSEFMKSLITKLNIDENIKENLTLDDAFLEEVIDNIELFNPICKLINSFQSSACSVADAVNLWIDVKLPSKFENKYGTILKSRMGMILNQYALTAYYLHPFYDTTKLTNVYKDIIGNFLFEELDGSGIRDWNNFRTRSTYFKKLYEKNIKDPIDFWKAALPRFPALSNLAIKLLQIPASSSQIEKLFINWSRVHSSTEKNLTFEQTKKLFHLYHSLRNTDDDNFNSNEQIKE